MTTTETVDAFLTKLTELGDKLIDAAEPALRTATDAALTAVWFRGVGNLASGIVAVALLAPILLYAAYHLFMMAKSAGLDEDGKEIVGTIGGGLSTLVGMGFFIAGALMLADSDTWLALLRPDAYLAAQALGL